MIAGALFLMSHGAAETASADISRIRRHNVAVSPFAQKLNMVFFSGIVRDLPR